MSTVAHILRIQELLDGWRVLGSARLSNGAELIGRVPGDDDAWMHAVFAGLDDGRLEGLERELGCALPRSLRGFYRGCGGMTLFSGAFTLCGAREPGVFRGDRALQPFDVVQFHRCVEQHGWLPRGAVAFALNGWDQTVHVAGMGEHEGQVVRCTRRDGAVVERHDGVLACVEDRLYRLDEQVTR